MRRGLTGLVALAMAWLPMPSVAAHRMEKPEQISRWDCPSFSRLNHYLEELWFILNGRYALDTLTSNPDGVRQGTTGEMVYAKFSGDEWFCVNSSDPSPGTSWTCLNITTFGTICGGTSADGEVLYNDGGACGGDPALTFNDTSKHMAVGAAATGPDFDLGLGTIGLSSLVDEEILLARETVTATTARDRNGILGYLTANPSANDTTSFYLGVTGLVDSLSSNTSNLGHLKGGRFAVRHDGTGTLTNLFGVDIEAEADTTSGTITNLYGAYILAEAESGGTVTNAHGMLIEVDWNSTATDPTNKYALKLRDLDSTDTIGGHNFGLLIGGFPSLSNSAAPDENGVNLFSSNAGVGTKAAYVGALNVLRGPVLIGPLADTNIPAPATLFIRNDNFPHEIVGTGTIANSGTTVTGTGTVFLSEARATNGLIVGSVLEVDTTPKQYRMITAVASDTSLTVDSSFTTSFTSATFTIKHPTVLVWSVDPTDGGVDSGIDLPFIINAVGDVGIGTRFPSEALEVNGSIKATSIAVTSTTTENTISGNVVISKADPTLIYDVATTTDTDFWVGVQDDAEADDDDRYQIGKGTTPGITPYLTIDQSGNVGIGTTMPARTVHISTALRLEPQTSAPASPAAGDLYVDSTPAADELCFYDGTTWQGISSGTDANCN